MDGVGTRAVVETREGRDDDEGNKGCTRELVTELRPDREGREGVLVPRVARALDRLVVRLVEDNISFKEG